MAGKYKVQVKNNDGSLSDLPIVATDSDKLNGQEASYYLNYNNFTNKPTIPSVSGLTTGASSSTDNAIVRFNGTGGKTIQNSKNTIDDSGNMVIADGATVKLSTYGTRKVTLSGNSINADMSAETGGWAGAFASVTHKSSTSETGKATTTMLGWYGNASDLTHIFMGGTYSDPALKMTPNGQFTFKSTPKVGTTNVALATNATTSAAGLMSSADKTKLNGIATGAEVNVQADWSVTDTSSDAYIKNKPTIPTVNNGTLTIQKNGTTVNTFTANSSSNVTANITVPTKVSQLENDNNFLSAQELDNNPNLTYYATDNGSTTAGTWVAKCDDVTALFDGLSVKYKIKVAGASTTTFNLNGLGAKTVYLRGTTKLTTHYAVDTVIILIYNSSTGAWYKADYDSNSDSKLYQYYTLTNSNAEYPIIHSYTTDTGTSSYKSTYGAVKSGFTFNPSTNTLSVGAIKENGTLLSDKYATKSEVSEIETALDNIIAIQNALIGGGV